MHVQGYFLLPVNTFCNMQICCNKSPTLFQRGENLLRQNTNFVVERTTGPHATLPHNTHTRTTPHPAHFEIGRITLAQKQIWENKTCMRGFSGKKWGRAGTYADRSLCTPQPHLNHTSTTPQPHLDHTSTAQTTTPQPHLHHISTTRQPPNR